MFVYINFYIHSSETSKNGPVFVFSDIFKQFFGFSANLGAA